MIALHVLFGEARIALHLVVEGRPRTELVVTQRVQLLLGGTPESQKWSLRARALLLLDRIDVLGQLVVVAAWSEATRLRLRIEVHSLTETDE